VETEKTTTAKEVATPSDEDIIPED
jgi:hypothetical protein